MAPCRVSAVHPFSWSCVTSLLFSLRPCSLLSMCQLQTLTLFLRLYSCAVLLLLCPPSLYFFVFCFGGGGCVCGDGYDSNKKMGRTQLVRLIHDVIGVEVLQVEGPDSRHAPPTSGGSSSHGLFGGARGIFGGSGGGGGSHGGGGARGAGLEALSIPMMLQLRPSKEGLCKVRSKGGGEDVLEASLASLTRGPGGSRGGGGAGGAGGGDALTILASVQPLAKLAQLRCARVCVCLCVLFVLHLS